MGRCLARTTQFELPKGKGVLGEAGLRSTSARPCTASYVLENLHSRNMLSSHWNQEGSPFTLIISV